MPVAANAGTYTPMLSPPLARVTAAAGVPVWTLASDERHIVARGGLPYSGQGDDRQPGSFKTRVDKAWDRTEVEFLDWDTAGVTRPADADRPLTALISWAHSDADWSQDQVSRREQDVLRLAAGLRAKGIDVDLDLYHAVDDVDWTRWGSQRVADVDVVLVVVSQAWKDAWEGRGDLRRNIGVGAEADALRSLSMESRVALLSKCRLLMLPNSHSRHIPDGLHGVPRHVIGGFDGSVLEAVVRDLTKQPFYSKPLLGAIPVLPPSLTYLTPDIAYSEEDNAQPAPIHKRESESVGDRDRERAQLRAQLAALPEPLPGDGPHLPWFRAREKVVRRLSELDKPGSGSGSGSGSGIVRSGPDRKPPVSTGQGVDWQRLSAPAGISWRTEWDTLAALRGACVTVHLVPLSADRGLSERVIAGIGSAMPGLIRVLAGLSDSAGIELDERHDHVTVAVEPVQARWNDVRDSEFRGSRLSRTGQVSVWYSLPADGMGAVIDEEQLADDLQRCLEIGAALLTVGGLAVDGRVGLACEISPVNLITDGTLAQLGNRSQASLRSTGRDDVRVDAEESVPTNSLSPPWVGAVASTLARLLLRRWQL
jgi:hypothetical protein